MEARRRRAKLIQICASENDLFGLDDAGRAHRYNFKTSMWVRLRRDGNVRSGTPGADGRALTSPSDVHASRRSART
jgi:hypothetical protein